jgi:hypothetical protein
MASCSHDMAIWIKIDDCPGDRTTGRMNSACMLKAPTKSGGFFQYLDFVDSVSVSSSLKEERKAKTGNTSSAQIQSSSLNQLMTSRSPQTSKVQSLQPSEASFAVPLHLLDFQVHFRPDFCLSSATYCTSPLHHLMCLVLLPGASV